MGWLSFPATKRAELVAYLPIEVFRASELNGDAADTD